MSAEGILVLNFAEPREKVYGSLFGPCETVSHEPLSSDLQIDVSIHPPTRERDFYTLVSSGMSDLRMNVPDEALGGAARAEVVLYVDEPAEEYIRLVRTVASLPHQRGTWLGRGHAIANGEPPQPLFAGSELDTVLLLPSIVYPDDMLPERLTVGGEPVELLWIVPITAPELALVRESGVEALADLLDDCDHPVALDPRRPSYV